MLMINPVLANLGLGFKQIGMAFVKDASIWWLIAPVIIFWVILEIYFDKYKTEELGWNTALGNGLSVLWISFICMKFLFDNKFENFSWPKLLAIIFIFIYGSLVVLNSFKHKLNKKVSFLLGAPTPIYFFSLIAVLWTNLNILKMY